MLTNPIPANQVVNVKLEWDCLTQPTCTTLEHSLQAMLNAICLLKKPLVQNTCINGEELTDILNDISTRLCEIENTNTEPLIDDTLFTINYCISDNWKITDDCNLGIGCGITPISKDEQIQILYNRMRAYCTVIKDLHTDIEDLKVQLNTLQLQVNTINTNCC